MDYVIYGQSYELYPEELTLRKVFVVGVFLVRIFRIWTGEILSITPYSVRMRKNTDQKNSEYGYFLCTITSL